MTCARRKPAPAFPIAAERCPMAANTPQEQLMLELINRARMDPAGEAARQGISLNQGLAAGTISTAPEAGSGDERPAGHRCRQPQQLDAHQRPVQPSGIRGFSERTHRPEPERPHDGSGLRPRWSGHRLWREHFMDRRPSRPDQCHKRYHRPAPFAVSVAGPPHQYLERRLRRGRHRTATRSLPQRRHQL